MLKVLWVDDIPQQMFINKAYNDGIDIENVICVNDGKRELQNDEKIWDAIILDANCKITGEPNEQPSIDALKIALYELVNIRPDVPWFVYTAGDYEGLDKVEFLIKNRPYDPKSYYQKPSQYRELIDIIKNVASKKDLYTLRQRYQREFDAAALIEGATQELLKGLTYNYEENHNNVQDYFNPARKIIERIFKKLKEQKLLPPINKLNSMSRFLCDKKIEDKDCSFVLKKEIMPKPLCHSLKFFLDITQDGSHDTDDLKLGVDSYIRNTKNTNLFNSILYIAMDLLLWHMDYSKTKSPVEEIWEGVFKFEYVGKLCKSASGRYWYTGEYEVLGDPSFTDGAKIGIKKSIPNLKPKPGVSKFVPKGCWIIIKE